MMDTDRIETYVSDYITFRKLDGEYAIFSNMYRTPLTLFGVGSITSPENLYLAGRFTQSDLQKKILSEPNPMKAKRIYKYQEQYKKYMREDWDENIWFEWMKFCLVLKYQQIKPFRDLLNSTLQLSIIEDSTLHNGASALIWGARDMEKRNAIKTLRKQLKTNGYSNPDIKSYINNAYDNLGSGIYTGRNLMGRLLMELRDKKGILSYQLTANFTILGNRVNNKDCWNNHLKL